MKYIAAIAVWAGVAAAGPCNNNCGRAVIGTARASPALADRSSMCADFVTTITTYTPPAATETVVIYNRNVHDRANPVIIGEKPAYAAACDNVEAYWNACQCFSDIKATVVTVTAATSTQTVPVATCTQGIEFGIYGVDSDDARRLNLHEAIEKGHAWVDFGLQFGGRTPDVVGVTPTLGSIIQFQDPYDVPVSIYGKQGPAGSTMGYGIVNHRGYLMPAVVGTYTISLETSDNAFYAWFGDNAVTGWNPTNPAVTRIWSGYEGEPSTYTINITADKINKPIPFRFVWINWGGPGSFSAKIVDPEGSTILGKNSVKNPQIITGCSGPEAKVSPWGPWANEIQANSNTI